MRRIAVASVALSPLVASFVAPASEGSPPTAGPVGRLCSYIASSDPAPDAEPDAMIGLVNGGPLLWDRNYWLHCHLQVDNNTHDGPDVAGGDARGPSWPHDRDLLVEVAVIFALVTYRSPEDSQDYLCTSVSWPNLNGPNWLYWHPGDNGPDGLPLTADDQVGHWSPDQTKPCSAATQVSTGPMLDPVDDAVAPTSTRRAASR